MNSAVRSMLFGAILATGLPVSALHAAEGESKALPTLLIKGEIVSVDTSDPTATLIKVKDRYGFETPIFLKTETKITQGDAALSASALSSGNTVEVEYNFDVNTAKRHAVSVKVAAAAQAAAPAAPAAAATPPEAPAVATPAPVAPATPAAPAVPAATSTATPGVTNTSTPPPTSAPAGQ